MTENNIATKVLDAAFKVHKNLGPGLLESSYQSCLCYELNNSGLLVKKEVGLPLIYDKVKLDLGYRVDLIVENKLIVEIKAVEAIHDVHLAQVLTYLKLTNYRLGLLLNFNVSLLKDGIKRVIL